MQEALMLLGGQVNRPWGLFIRGLLLHHELGLFNLSGQQDKL